MENSGQFSITKQFQESAKMINDNLPRKKESTEIVKPNNSQVNIVEDPLITKMKKWILIILTCLVVGGAAIMILASFIGKFNIFG